MARVETIVVGGGISAGSPFVLNSFLIVGNVDPPLSVTGNMRQDSSTPPKVFIGDSLLTAGITVIGGATSNVNAGLSVVIGNGASLLPTGAMAADATSVVIGRAAIGSTATTGKNVVIGDNARADSGGTAASSVVIGAGTQLQNPAGGANTVVIGAAAIQSLGSQSVLIGSTALYAANNGGVVIGFNAQATGGAGTATPTIVGSNSQTNKTRNILIGPSLVENNGTDSVIIGNSYTSTVVLSNAVQFFNSAGYTTFVVGKGLVSTAAQALLFRLTSGSGVDNVAGALTLQAGLSTGAGASPAVNLNVGIVQASGATVQTSRTGVACSHTAVATETYLMVYDVDNATLERVSVGAPDSGGLGFKVLRIPN